MSTTTDDESSSTALLLHEMDSRLYYAVTFGEYSEFADWLESLGSADAAERYRNIYLGKPNGTLRSYRAALDNLVMREMPGFDDWCVRSRVLARIHWSVPSIDTANQIARSKLGAAVTSWASDKFKHLKQLGQIEKRKQFIRLAAHDDSSLRGP